MKELTSKKIGMRINTLLADKGMKQKDLAKKLGVTDNTVSYYVSGSRTPNLEQIINICEIFNVSSDYILGLSDVQTRNETIEGINAETGLSQKAIVTLMVEKDIGFDTTLVDFISFLISKMERVVLLITAILQANKFNSAPQICSLDIDGNDIELELNVLYKTYAEKLFWEIVSQYKEGE